jgi:hypothetical protein
LKLRKAAGGDRIEAGGPAAKPALLMNATQAAIFGILAYPYLPVITSPAVAANSMVAIDTASFVSAVGVPDFDVSSEAAVHLENTARCRSHLAAGLGRGRRADAKPLAVRPDGLEINSRN